MPFVPVENVAEVEIRMLFDGQKVENTIYFLAESGWNVAALQGLAEAVHEWWDTNISPLASENVLLNEIVATDLTTDTSAQYTDPGGASAGANTGIALPNSSTLAISFKTAQRGRSFRGRNYIVGLNVDDRDGTNNVDSGVIASWIAAYDLLRTAADLGDTYPWVVVSRFSGVDSDGKPIPRTAGVATRVLSVTVADATIDAQRRRLPGRGQ